MTEFENSKITYYLSKEHSKNNIDSKIETNKKVIDLLLDIIEKNDTDNNDNEKKELEELLIELEKIRNNI